MSEFVLIMIILYIILIFIVLVILTIYDECKREREIQKRQISHIMKIQTNYETVLANLRKEIRNCDIKKAKISMSLRKKYFFSRWVLKWQIKQIERNKANLIMMYDRIVAGLRRKEV